MTATTHIPTWAAGLDDGLLNLYLGLPPKIRHEMDSVPLDSHQKEIWATACHLRSYVDEAIALIIVKQRWSGYHKCVDYAIERAVSNAFYQETRNTGRHWPQKNPDTIRNALSGCAFSVESLKRTTGIDTPADLPPGEIIQALFPQDSLICMGITPKEVKTASMDQMCAIHPTPSYIVPNPMSNRNGTTKEGKTSPRCLDNTGARYYLVVEFDSLEADVQATLHHHLGEYLPRVLTLSSGNKSIHGWYLCRNHEEEKIEKFMRYAVSIGADPATYTTCQLVRTPNAMRDTNRKQEVLTFNPNLIQ
jgi:hypothetical protein